MSVAVALALAAGLCLGTGAVLQQRIAGTAPAHRPLHPRLLTRHLLRRPLWLLGVAVAVGGYGAQAAALGTGRLAVVEPLLVSSLVFALPLSAAWSRRRLGGRDWLAVLLTAGGLAAFLLVSRPGGGEPAAPLSAWGPAFGVLAVGMAGAVAAGLRVPAVVRAATLAAVAGVGFGISDALTKSTLALAAVRRFGVLLSWEPYALVVAAAAAFLLQQSAYHAGHLAASLPATSVLEPSVGVLLGVLVLGERLQGGGLSPAVEGLAAVAMVSGVVLLARSPLVSGARAGPATPRRP